MNRGSMRTLLERRLQDTGNDGYTDAVLNDLLNVGLGLVQNEVLKVNAHAFVAIETFPSVADQPYYEKPANIYHEIELAVSDSGVEGGYRPLSKTPWRGRSTGTQNQGDLSYSEIGQYWWISPTPSASVAAYFRLIYHYLLSMSDDDQSPRLHASLHSCVVDYAVIEALGETWESGEDAMQRLEKKLAAISAIYGGNVVPVGIGVGASFRTT